MGRTRRAERWSVVALVLAVAPFVVAWLPLGTETSADSNGKVTTSHPSLLESEGRSVLVVLVVPIVIALIPVLLHRSAVAQTARVIAAVLMTVGVLLALASIGIFYVPALAALVTAAAIGHQRSAVRSV